MREFGSFLNLTFQCEGHGSLHMCKDGGKEWSDYIRNSITIGFVTELATSMNISIDLLIDQILNGPNQSRGTFVHSIT